MSFPPRWALRLADDAAVEGRADNATLDSVMFGD